MHSLKKMLMVRMTAKPPPPPPEVIPEPEFLPVHQFTEAEITERKEVDELLKIVDINNAQKNNQKKL